jgi:hypothetical protein
LPALTSDGHTGEQVGLRGLHSRSELGGIVRVIPRITPAADDAAHLKELCAAYWYAQGVLELDPKPGVPAPAAPVICFRCRGAEAGCLVCLGVGHASLSAQAEALRAAA